MTDDTDALKAEIASLEEKNAELVELKAQADEQKKKLVEEVKEVVAESKAELAEALAYKSEELNDSQTQIEDQGLEIDTLKDLIHKLQVDKSAMEVMIMFAEPKDEDIDIDALWDRTIAYIATKRGSVDEAVAAAVKQYTLT